MANQILSCKDAQQYLGIKTRRSFKRWCRTYKVQIHTSVGIQPAFLLRIQFETGVLRMIYGNIEKYDPDNYTLLARMISTGNHFVNDGTEARLKYLVAVKTPLSSASLNALTEFARNIK